MITNKQKALINDCYDRLNVLNDVTWTRYRDDLFKMEKKSERDHRNGHIHSGREYSKRAISINDSARYFACKHILDALVQEPPSLANASHSVETVLEQAASVSEAPLLEPPRKALKLALLFPTTEPLPAVRPPPHARN